MGLGGGPKLVYDARTQYGSQIWTEISKVCLSHAKSGHRVQVAVVSLVGATVVRVSGRTALCREEGKARLKTSQWSPTLSARGQRRIYIMNTQELAKAFTDLCAKGELEAAGKKFWSDDIVSREPMTGDMAVLKGRKAVEGKSEW